MDEKTYSINNKNFKLKDDFTYAELEWIDVVYVRLSQDVSKKTAAGKNEINGEFTREEIERTLIILLEGSDDSKFTHDDFLECTEGKAVKIIADFFLWKAIVGATMQNISMN